MTSSNVLQEQQENVFLVWTNKIFTNKILWIRDALAAIDQCCHWNTLIYVCQQTVTVHNVQVSALEKPNLTDDDLVILRAKVKFCAKKKNFSFSFLHTQSERLIPQFRYITFDTRPTNDCIHVQLNETKSVATTFR